MNKTKKKHEIKEGFGMGALLSADEIILMRAIAGRQDFEIDKENFEKVKSEHRKTDVADFLSVQTFIENVAELYVADRNESKGDANDREKTGRK